MLKNTTYIKINKLISDEKLTINELYELISYMNRRYIELSVQDNIIRFIDNRSVNTDKIEDSENPDSKLH